uniref:SRPBCC domain-containing protein n=1 Tax=uncultured Erythrobacter sp. TaxID=263913 RepID=UPI0026227891|nr:SRPBCC domain-containing protein [uncultured Erythrobacter sp.]
MSESNPFADKAVYEIFIEAPIEKVWSELVKTDEVLPFFFGSVCKTTGELKVGAPMAMETTNGKYRSVVGEVLEFDPPNRYSHTFKFTGHDDPPCVVTYELEADEGGTKFSLVTTKVPAGTKTENGMTQGGKFIVNTFKQVVEQGRPNLGTRMMLGLMGLAQPFTPKKCRSENWTFEQIKEL